MRLGFVIFAVILVSAAGTEAKEEGTSLTDAGLKKIITEKDQGLKQEAMKLKKIDSSGNLDYATYTQEYNGVPVFGSYVVAAENKQGGGWRGSRGCGKGRR